MAALEGIAADLRAVLAAHVAFQLMDRRSLRSAYDVQSDGLVGIAAETADLKVAVSGVERVAEGRGTAAPAPCSRAFVGSKLRRRACRLACAPHGRARQTLGSMRRRCSGGTSCS
jgi:hypothetical protein